jgi:hypothetical protein
MNAVTDLLGFPLTPEVAAPAKRRRAVTLEARRVRFCRRLEQSCNLLLFEDLLVALSCPLLEVGLPEEFASDIGEVAVPEDEDTEGDTAKIAIPYAAWGKPWVTDSKQLSWSEEGIRFLQVRLFWRSMEELGLNNNAREKLSVLKWIFRPAFDRSFIFDTAKGKSHRLLTHERDDTFSFHNCCMAARMDEDILREGVRRNIPKDILQSVERAYTLH